MGFGELFGRGGGKEKKGKGNKSSVGRAALKGFEGGDARVGEQHFSKDRNRVRMVDKYGRPVDQDGNLI